MTLDKIRIKGGAKRYKRGPGPTGAARLARRVHRLALDAARLARKQDVYAARLFDHLSRFVTEDPR
jgi:CO/xanthine dehydrogenase Mo-binding subunit